MGILKLKFSPIFIIFAFIIIYFGWVKEFIIYFVVMLLHELAHYTVAKIYGYKLNKIIFMPYGAGLSGESNIFNPKHEIIIALAGPLLNLVLVVACVALWWIFPITYAYTDIFVTSNLVLGIFNLLPVFPLDGGRVVLAYFSEKVNKQKIYKIMKYIGISFSVIFCLLFFVSAFYKLNLNYIFIALFLLTSSFNNVSNVYYERAYIKNFSYSKNVKPVEVKTYAVNVHTPVLKLVKYIKGNYFTQFAIYDDNNKLIKVITETELFKMLNLK